MHHKIRIFQAFWSHVIAITSKLLKCKSLFIHNQKIILKYGHMLHKNTNQWFIVAELFLSITSRYVIVLFHMATMLHVKYMRRYDESVITFKCDGWSSSWCLACELRGSVCVCVCVCGVCMSELPQQRVSHQTSRS